MLFQKRKSSEVLPPKQKSGAWNEKDKSMRSSAEGKAIAKEDEVGAIEFLEQPVAFAANPLVPMDHDNHGDTSIDDYNVDASSLNDIAKWSPKFDDDPWKNDLRIWSGKMVMAGYFRFDTTLTAVSGAGAFALRDSLPAEINIIGRIPPIVVWEYIKSVKHSGIGKDLIVLQANEPDDPESKAQYEGLFNNMRAKGRYVVVGRFNPRMIKDFYLLPLSSHDSPPEELLPFEGVGLAPPGARRNVILCVIVRKREEGPMDQAA
uniref:Spen paralogue and orthologue SPOC C-terminal domain-containing protein n=1 Tax=Plectus sambesii TaxID=2011161 RepID=A0A914VF79_9BILA